MRGSFSVRCSAAYDGPEAVRSRSYSMSFQTRNMGTRGATKEGEPMDTTATDRSVSADGHVVEPADLWTTRMEKPFRGRAPHVDSRSEGDFYIIDWLEP